MNALLHWLNVEYWGQSWPNIFSPNFWTLAALALHLAVTWIQRERQHREAQKEAGAVRRIAADLYRNHTGQPHPDAPDSESEAK